jgi:xylulokinase
MSSSPLFIGLDNSTQALKAVVIDEHLNTHYEHRLDFSEDLPEYKTKSGVIVTEDGSVLAPVLMYVEAMEKVFENLKSQ